MKTFLEILDIAQFPEDTRAYLQKVYAGILEAPALPGMLEKAVELVYAKEDTAPLRLQLAEAAGIHPYTMDLVVLVLCYARLRRIYREKGWGDDLFAESVADLRYKLEECRRVYGIDGNFVFHWYPGFFDCTRFKLGRLQYEPHIMKNDYRDILKEGDVIYRCHIPMAGPLTPELLESSLRQAWEFFKPEGPLYVHCASWLLYPGHYELYPEGSNLRRFYDRFDVYAQRITPDNANAWRVFGTMEKNPARLPGDTALQRAFRSYLAQGNVMGSGYGVLIYEPK